MRRRTAAINHALQTCSGCGAEKVEGTLYVHLALAAPIVEGIELPSQVQAGVDPAFGPEFRQQLPGHGRIKPQKLRRTGQCAFPAADVHAKDEFAIRIGAKLRHKRMG